MTARTAAARGNGSGPTVADHRSTTSNRELKIMLMYEVLARIRMREDQRLAHRARLAGRLVAARRWQWLARYADHRARRAIGDL